MVRSIGPPSSATLNELGYTGGVAIEHEDEIYGWHTGGDLFDEGLVRGWQVLASAHSPDIDRVGLDIRVEA